MRSRRLSIIAVSLGLHVVVVLGLFVAGFWHLDRLEAGKRTISIAVAPPPPAPSGGPSGLPAVTLHRKPPAIGLRLPTLTPPTPPSAAAAIGSSLPGDGSATGPGVGPGDSTDTGSCIDPPCGEAPQPPAPPPDPPKPPQVPTTVAPSVLGGLRISGDTQIQPPDPVKIRMMRDGHARTTPTFKLCLAESGAITSVTLIRTSGYPEYDRALAAGIHGWVYRPYEIAGRPVPACGAVTFVYSIE